MQLFSRYSKPMGRPTHKAEYQEGPEAAKNFDAAMRKIITVSPEEIKRRIEAATAKKAASRVPAASR